MANARFQAAAALQESTIREWSLLMADEKSNMRKYVKKILFILFIVGFNSTNWNRCLISVLGILFV